MVKHFFCTALSVIISTSLSAHTHQKIDLTQKNPYFYDRSDGYVYSLEAQTASIQPAGRHQFNVTTPYGPGLLMTTMPPQKEFLAPCMEGFCNDPMAGCGEIPGNQTKCIPYHNTEIYSSSCCSVHDFIKANATALERVYLQSGCNSFYSYDPYCHLIPNPGFFDTQLQNYIADFYLNEPFAPGRGIEANIKFENFKQGGSLGFGFWNTQMGSNIEMAWFMYQHAPGYSLNGLYVMVFRRNQLPFLQKLKDLDEEWHKYRIDWQTDKMVFSVDGAIVSVVPTMSRASSLPMAPNLWSDNGVFEITADGVNHAPQFIQTPKKTTIANLSFIEL